MKIITSKTLHAAAGGQAERKHHKKTKAYKQIPPLEHPLPSILAHSIHPSNIFNISDSSLLLIGLRNILKY
jgi:hypothetical protein